MAKPLRIADNKHKFVALLDEACRRLDIDDEDRQARLIALAVRCDLDKATLFRAVERDGLPALGTLRAAVCGSARLALRSRAWRR